MINYDIEAKIVSNSIIPFMIFIIIGVFVFTFPQMSNNRFYTPFGRKALPLLIALAFPFLIITSFGPALLAISGIIVRQLDGQLTLEMIKTEVTSGTLVLRLSSVIIAYHIVRLEIKKLSFLFDRHNDTTKQEQELKKKKIIISETQYLFYGICAAALWQNLLDGQASFYFASLTAWAMIYILDDWTIIQEYLVDQDIYPSRWLYRKIYLFNFILTGSAFYIFASASISSSILFFGIPLVCISPYWLLKYNELKSQIPNL
jgi:hypothetical protein